MVAIFPEAFDDRTSIMSRIAMPRLTKKLVETLPCSSAATYAWDDQLSGFGVKILPTGKKKYVVKYRVGGGRTGRPRWYLVGAHGQLTCEQAREIATQVLAAVARGEDPQGQKELLRAAPTVADLWKRFEDEHLPRKKPRSADGDRQIATAHLMPALGRLKVVDVSRKDIQALHHAMAEMPYQANRTIALMSKMMSLAEVWGYRPDGSNPCRHIVKYREQARQRYLSPDELIRVGKALSKALAANEINVHMDAAIRLLLLTGARVSEILGARWEWVDWNRRVIALPDSKTGAKPLFLSEQAIELLRLRKAAAEGSDNPYVIEGRLAGKPLVNLAKPWALIRKRAGVEDVRIHDLRHTAASIGVASGLNLPVIGRLLGHTQAATTQRYAHVDIDPALAAINTIGAAITASLNGETATRDEGAADTGESGRVNSGP
ncbi:site-specific integrase [Rhodoblastus sp.]|uniref:tyrosine-type recombinase/integrase n=1 Tax=Rhodoblastus sp. TaxID=1962975 RepID=UPI0025F92127|nr:site-specific integrase [Rhodoblastus sp.]